MTKRITCSSLHLLHLHMDNKGLTRRGFMARAVALAGALAARAGLSSARPVGTGLYFRENFHRAREGWGSPWHNPFYNHRWWVRGGRGHFRLPPPAYGRGRRSVPVFALDRDVEDLDLEAVFDTTDITARAGLFCRAVSYFDFYSCYLDEGSRLQIARCSHHHEDVRASKKTALRRDRRYRMRFQIDGTAPTSLRAKVWPAGEREPQKWTLEYADATSDAIAGRGPFGIYLRHGQKGHGATASVDSFRARSRQRHTATDASIVYSLVGSPFANGKAIRAVAKSSIPAAIGFEYGLDPSFSADVVSVSRQSTDGRALTRHATFDLTEFPPSSVVYWRAFTVRKKRITYGPTSTFRTPPAPPLPVKFAFGSCTQPLAADLTSFKRAQETMPDFYLHQGDFGYPRLNAPLQQADMYQDCWVRMFGDDSLTALTNSVPFAFFRDDSEYGANMADRNTLMPFTIRAHEELNANPSNSFFKFRYGGVSFFVIDCRRFSTGEKRPNGTKIPKRDRSKLGAEQTKWLKRSMRKAVDGGEGLLVVCSPMAFGSDLQEGNWRHEYTAEWRELQSFFMELKAPVLIVSGNSHGHKINEYPHRKMDPNLPRVVEFVSSGTEQYKWPEDEDPDVLVKAVKGDAFGLVELGPEQQVGDQIVRTLSLTCVKSTDGTPRFKSDYVVVPGLGILPAGSAPF